MDKKLAEKTMNAIFTKDKWMVAEEVEGIDFAFCQIWISSFVNEMENSVRRNYNAVISIHKGNNANFYYREKDSNEFAEHVLSKIIQNPGFGKKINEKIIELSDKLVKNAEKNAKNYSRLSNKELAELYLKQDKMHTELYEYGWLPNAIDMFHANYTNYLLKYLESIHVPEEERNHVLMKLTALDKKSVLSQEQENLWRIAAEIEKDEQTKKIFQKNSPEKILELLPEKLSKKISLHWNKYKHLKFQWLGLHGVYSKEHYVSEIKKIISGKKPAKQLIEEEKKHLVQAKKEKKELEESLGIDEKHRDLFELWPEFMLSKLYRRNAQIKNHFIWFDLRKEIAKRLNLPIQSVYFMFPQEVKKTLIEGKTDENELRERSKFCVYFAVKGKDTIFTGEKAEKIADKIKGNELIETDLIKGQCGSPGKAKGKAKIINSPKDMDKMNQGDVLVSVATNPDIVPAMKKAAAIVTEQGGVTSHAAIVARELKIPCVIGTKIATKALKDNDLIEVDAGKGIVKKVKE